VGSTQLDAVALVAASGVAVVHIAFQDEPEMPFARDEDPVGDLAADGGDPAFGGGVHPRRLRRGEHYLDASRREYGVEGSGELRVAVPDQV
jgi:hypothetical protein